MTTPDARTIQTVMHSVIKCATDSDCYDEGDGFHWCRADGFGYGWKDLRDPVFLDNDTSAEQLAWRRGRDVGDHLRKLVAP